jgi:hypothetical protein
MPTIVQTQAQIIADWYAVVARALSDAATLPGHSTQERLALTQASSACSIQSSNLATRAAQVAFADAAQAFTDISDAASQAAAVAKKLSAEAKKTAELLKVAEGAVAFAKDALTGSYGSALSDLVALVGKPVTGQGAGDPLGG